MPETLDIFIVEDDDDARASLIDILALDNHRVMAFPSAQEAMEHDAFTNVDVILIDRKLPDGLAEELLPELKSQAQHADFIVITGYADMNAAIAALREGVSDYIIKPIDPDALRATLSRLAKRRAVERELYRQRRFAEKLLDTAEAAILILDVKGKLLRANRYFLELTGYSLVEIAEADWFEIFIPPRDRDHIRQVFEQTVTEFKTRGIINPIVTKDDRECEMRWSNSTLRNAAGETAAVLCVGLDVTGYVQAQRKLVQNERLAAIGQTMAGLAHESRNALQRLQIAVELLQEELAGQDQALADLAKIERAGKQIRDLMEEVRGYAAPINLHLVPESIRTVWRRAWRSLAHRLDGRTAKLDESQTDSLAESDFKLPLDARRVEQVFRNLFENALDAADGQLRIEIGCQVTDDAIHVTVQDNGPGVPAAMQDQLFEAFVTSKPTGTGLGLAICFRTIEAHGGQLRCEPSNSGTMFVIDLPRLH